MDATKNNTLAGKKIVAFALLAATLSVAAVLVAEQQPALAQTSSNSTTSSNSGSSNSIPALNGSVSISNATNAFVKANVKVDFNTAASAAKSQVANGVIVGGQLSEVQGYLAYTFRVANYDSGTSKVVIVDAGNGKVLYTSGDLPLYNGGIGGGCHHGGSGWGYGQGRTSSGTSSSASSGQASSNL